MTEHPPAPEADEAVSFGTPHWGAPRRRTNTSAETPRADAEVHADIETLLSRRASRPAADTKERS